MTGLESFGLFFCIMALGLLAAADVERRTARYLVPCTCGYEEAKKSGMGMRDCTCKIVEKG